MFEESEAWSISSKQHFEEAIYYVHCPLKKADMKFYLKVLTKKVGVNYLFFVASHSPEIDIVCICTDDKHAFNYSFMGMMRWIVELGQLGIDYVVTIMSRYLAQLHVSSLHLVLRIFKYLHIHPDGMFIRFKDTCGIK